MSKVIGYIIVIVTLLFPRSPKASPVTPLPPSAIPTSTPSPTPLPTDTPLPPAPRNCGPSSWWDLPVLGMYAIAAIIEAQQNGWELCPPPGSEWERALTVPGYWETQAAPTPTTTVTPTIAPPATPTLVGYPPPYP